MTITLPIPALRFAEITEEGASILLGQNRTGLEQRVEFWKALAFGKNVKG